MASLFAFWTFSFSFPIKCWRTSASLASTAALRASEPPPSRALMRASSVFVSAWAASAAALRVSALAEASFSFSSALAMSSEAFWDLVSNCCTSLASFCLSLPLNSSTNEARIAAASGACAVAFSARSRSRMMSWWAASRNSVSRVAASLLNCSKASEASASSFALDVSASSNAFCKRVNSDWSGAAPARRAASSSLCSELIVAWCAFVTFSSCSSRDDASPSARWLNS
mmetsp:Transcript_6596/g.16785  ORF Transcript_6596/g.16785 Transcript_6596/m.16785 type:complete len:229 (+) Transcript_6596:1615-2301(+)